jgi:hypothetical protein
MRDGACETAVARGYTQMLPPQLKRTCSSTRLFSVAARCMMRSEGGERPAVRYNLALLPTVRSANVCNAAGTAGGQFAALPCTHTQTHDHSHPPSIHPSIRRDLLGLAVARNAQYGRENSAAHSLAHAVLTTPTEESAACLVFLISIKALNRPHGDP